MTSDETRATHAERLRRDVAANEAARREILRSDGRRTPGENLEQADSLIKAAFELRRAFTDAPR